MSGPAGWGKARFALAVGASAVCLTMGSWWAVDRSRAWETPRWREVEFVRLDEGSRRAAPEVWVVPVNPDCPHCAGHLARAASARARADGARVIALVVDQSRRPVGVPFADAGADEVWWDRDGIWRARWGHRLYGEVLRFDAHGRLRAITPARGAPPDAAESEARGSVNDP